MLVQACWHQDREEYEEQDQKKEQCDDVIKPKPIYTQDNDVIQEIWVHIYSK